MKLNLLVIRSAQPAVLAAFYTQLGINFEYHRHGTGPLHYAAAINGLVLEIYPLQKGQLQADSGLRLGFKLDNPQEVIEALRLEEVAIISEPIDSPWGCRAVFQDPDGRKVELY